MIEIVTAIVVVSGVFLAFSNGANDNFKGVATLYGSGSTSYKKALAWATFTTLAGSLTAFFLAQKLLTNFSGKGLVSDLWVGVPAFSAAVALGAASTVALATRLGFPISTTHAITGALVGAGLFADMAGVNGLKLLTAFLLPLLLSPFLSIFGASLLYPVFSALKARLGVKRESCLCIGREVLVPAPAGMSLGTSPAILQMGSLPQLSIGTEVTCEERYNGDVLGVNAKSILDSTHFFSAGLVSFARGLNDTPKIAAILLVGGSFSLWPSLAMVATAMAIGGLIFSKRIAETMSHGITAMNDGQGLSANFVTSTIVIGASSLGLPVSTTHVSCGALFGIGTVTGQAHWGSIIKIVLAWVVTLPTAGLLGYLAFGIIQGATR